MYLVFFLAHMICKMYGCLILTENCNQTWINYLRACKVTKRSFFCVSVRIQLFFFKWINVFRCFVSWQQQQHQTNQNRKKSTRFNITAASAAQNAFAFAFSGFCVHIRFVQHTHTHTLCVRLYLSIECLCSVPKSQWAVIYVCYCMKQ